MAALTIQSIIADGLNPVMSPADIAGDTVAIGANKNVFIELDNAGASPVVMTLVTTVTVDGLPVQDRVVTVPAGERRLVGPLDPSLYSSNLSITYDQVAAATVGAFMLAMA